MTFVTITQKRILDGVKNHLSPKIIAEQIGKRESDVNMIIGHCIKKGYIKRTKTGFVVQPIEFIVANKEKVYNQQSSIFDSPVELMPIPEIKKYEPSQYEQELALNMRKAGYTRSQIAKEMNLPKTAILWILCDADRGLAASPNEDYIFCDRLQYSVFRLLSKPTPIKQIADRLKKSIEQIESVINELIEMEAVTVMRHRNNTAILQNDVELRAIRKRDKKNENKKVKSEC